jgi:predicted negative regulator of RcsB-dependent stress response
MVEDYLSDREQEEALRNWWRDNWSWVVGGIVIGLALLGGYQYWQQRQRTQAENAAQTYSELAAALAARNKDTAATALKKLDLEHSGSPYTDQGHLLMAKDKVGGGQFEQALAELAPVIERSKDPALKQLARVRAAQLHLQLGHPDDALKFLDPAQAAGFAQQVNELRGDALLAKGDRAGARAAYQAALGEATPNAMQESQLLRLKLEEVSDGNSADNSVPVGDAPATAAPEPAK